MEPYHTSTSAGIDPQSRDHNPRSVDPRDLPASSAQIPRVDSPTQQAVQDRARQPAALDYVVTDTHRDRAPAQIIETTAVRPDPIASGLALQPGFAGNPIASPPPTPIASPERNGARSEPSLQPGASPILRQIALIHEASKGLLAVHGKKRYPPILMLECEPDEKTILSAAMRMKETSPSDDELREIGRMIVAKSKFPFKGRSEQTYPLKLLVGDRIWGPLMLEVRGSLRAKAPSSEKPAGPARPLHDGKYPYSDAEIRGAFMMGTLSREEWPDLSKAFPPEQPAPPRKERRII